MNIGQMATESDTPSKIHRPGGTDVDYDKFY